MIRHFNGDLLDSKCDIIAHQVNLQGLMGGGIARQIAIKYPQCEVVYSKCVETIKNEKNLLGQVLIHKYAQDKYIANCFSQNIDFTTNYEAVKKCFEFLLNCKKYNYSTIGVPYKYGCGIANGEWSKVMAIMEELFADSEIELQIWRFEN